MPMVQRSRRRHRLNASRTAATAPTSRVGGSALSHPSRETTGALATAAGSSSSCRRTRPHQSATHSPTFSVPGAASEGPRNQPSRSNAPSRGVAIDPIQPRQGAVGTTRNGSAIAESVAPDAKPWRAVDRSVSEVDDDVGRGRIDGFHRTCRRVSRPAPRGGAKARAVDRRRSPPPAAPARSTSGL